MRNILTQKQIEMEFAGARPCARAMRRQHRASRSNWWFNQMRELVDRAFDWEPAPEPRFQAELIPHRLIAITDAESENNKQTK